MANNITKDLYKKRIYVRNNWPKPYDKGFLVSGAPKNKINFFLKNFLHIYKKYNN